MNLNKLFTVKDKEEIADAVKSVERVSSGEIVPMIVRHSSSYKTIEIYFSIFCSLLFSTLTLLILDAKTFTIFNTFHKFMAFYIALLFAGFVIGALLFKIEKLRYMIIARHFKELKVHQAAQRSFFENGLYKTRHKTGIFIYISMFERKVVVIGDEGINSKLQQEDWDNAVKIIIDGIKIGKIKDGIVAGIKSCSEMLQKHFPIESDDTNELSDEMIIK